MYSSLLSSIIAGALGLASVVPVGGQGVCRPKLTVTDVRFSEMVPPTLRRKWTAIVLVDASACQENSGGQFQIIFTRASETAPDLEFTEQFAWRPPSVDVAIDFAADEAVQQFRVENVTSCVCIK